MYLINDFLFPSPSWFTGRRPEFTDPRVVARGEGREGKSWEGCRQERQDSSPQLSPPLLPDNAPAARPARAPLNQFHSPLLSPSDEGAVSRLCDHFLQRGDQGHEEAGLRRAPE